MHANSFLLTTSEAQTCQPIQNKMEKESDGVDRVHSTAEAARFLVKPSEIIEPAALQDKKDAFWLNGMVECFTTILAIFGREDDKTTTDNNWEVSLKSITDMEFIGSGAHGVVFTGMFRGEKVAVKKLKEQTETNFKHLRKLNHENIVRFKGACSQAPFYCVIMEYCRYGPLYNLLHDTVIFSPKQIIKWAKEIAQGMAYLHSHKILHRDLKSPNILLGDNFVVKLSDFGTSREWNDVSAIMSFTGTVAWMAPEIIRREPCSDKVDVWSYGVVLWELLTQAIPYKNLETHAIMWGVGTGSLSLPIPPSIPESLHLLMKQCWDRVPRNRPSFKFIAMHLEIAGQGLTALEENQFDATQANWRKDVANSLQEMNSRSEVGGGRCGDGESAEARRRRDETRFVRDLRRVCKQQVSQAKELYMEVCAARLQLEQRERAIARREKVLNGCRCGGAFRKNIKQLYCASSSSSDGVKAPLACLKQVLQEARIHHTTKKRQQSNKQNDKAAQNITDCQVYPTANINNKICNNNEQMNTSAVKLTCNAICNNINNALNTVLEKKDTLIECNGNVEVTNIRQPKNASLNQQNGNSV